MDTKHIHSRDQVARMVPRKFPTRRYPKPKPQDSMRKFGVLFMPLDPQQHICITYTYKWPSYEHVHVYVYHMHVHVITCRFVTVIHISRASAIIKFNVELVDQIYSPFCAPREPRFSEGEGVAHAGSIHSTQTRAVMILINAHYA